MTASMYAPDYLRNQKDPNLHNIADMIEQQVKDLAQLRKDLAVEKDLGIKFLASTKPLADDMDEATGNKLACKILLEQCKVFEKHLGIEIQESEPETESNPKKSKT